MYDHQQHFPSLRLTENSCNMGLLTTSTKILLKVKEYERKFISSMKDYNLIYITDGEEKGYQTLQTSLENSQSLFNQLINNQYKALFAIYKAQTVW